MMSMGVSSSAWTVIPWGIWSTWPEARAVMCLALHLICYLTLATREIDRQTETTAPVERPGSPSVYPVMNLSSVPSQAANRIVRHTEYFPGTSRSSSPAIKIESPSSLPSSTMQHTRSHRTGAPSKSLQPPPSPSLLSSDICYPRWDGISSRG